MKKYKQEAFAKNKTSDTVQAETSLQSRNNKKIA